MPRSGICWVTGIEQMTSIFINKVSVLVFDEKSYRLTKCVDFIFRSISFLPSSLYPSFLPPLFPSFLPTFLLPFPPSLSPSLLSPRDM